MKRILGAALAALTLLYVLPTNAGCTPINLYAQSCTLELQVVPAERMALAPLEFSFISTAQAQTPPTTQNTVTTTGPVSSSTTIEVGTIAGQALMWVLATFGTIMGTALTSYFVRGLQKLGLETKMINVGRLQGIVVDALNKSAADIAAAGAGRAGWT